MSINLNKLSGNKIYSVGTLKYTFVQLCVVFFWMLWGAVAMNIIGGTFNGATQFILRDHGLSDTFIIVLMSSVYSLMNMVMNPVLSFNSDRCQHRLGRRIPFILYTAVPLGIAVTLMPFYPLLIGVLPEMNILGLSTKELVFGLGGVFYFFNWLFVGALYYYLIPDVIPVELMGRYYGFFRVAGILAGMFFSKFIFPHAVKTPEIVYPAVGCFYTVSILAMCFFVREGRYQVPEKTAKKAWYIRLANAVKSYVSDCYSRKYYWVFYVVCTVYGLTACINVFNNFFYIDGCAMTLEQCGEVGVITGFFGFFACLFSGFFVDRFGGFVTSIVALGMVAVFNVCGGLFIHDFTSAVIWRVPLIVGGCIYAVASGRMLVEVFPRTKFGQFAAAQAMFNALVVALINYPVGKLSDFVKNAAPDTTLMIGGIDFMNFLRNYRFINYWSACCAVIAMILLIIFLIKFQSKRTDKAEDL